MTETTVIGRVAIWSDGHMQALPLCPTKGAAILGKRDGCYDLLLLRVNKDGLHTNV